MGSECAWSTAGALSWLQALVCAGVRSAKAVTAMKMVPCTAGLSRMWQENGQADRYMLLYMCTPLVLNRNNTTLTSAACSRFPTQQAAGMFVVWR